MNKAALIAELQALGIIVDNDRVKKSDIDQVLAKDEILVKDMDSHIGVVPAASKKKVTNVLHELGKKYHREIPLDSMFSVLESVGLKPVQEDGTEWSGLLVGTKGEAQIDLAMQKDGQWVLAKSRLIFTWYKMESGNYEIVAYLS